MAGIKDIRTHIKSVEQTLKITNAMYLISSSNLRRARRQLNNVEPYFRKIEVTISDILHHSPEISHPFFDKRPEISPAARKVGYIVVSGDKGLAGAYNHNILKLAEEKLAKHPNASLFVVGQMGRSYFQEHHIPIDGEFLYTAQNPTIARARDIAENMMDQFLAGSLDDVYILFTRLVSSFDLEPTVHKLLPLDPDVFPEYEANRDTYNREVAYVPSVKAVMDRLIYAPNKYYGPEGRQPALWKLKQVAAIASCGYHPDRGADLWDEGLKRWCKHGEMDYLGMLCRRDFGPQEPFMNEERDEAARDFAHALYLTVSLSL